MTQAVVNEPLSEEELIDLTEGNELPIDEVDEPLYESEKAFHFIWNGEGLKKEDVADISVSGPTKLIAVVGSVGSGKTTLVASLFLRFQQGEFAGFSFAGSKTLVGFEQRCFESMAISGRNHPDTERTSLNAKDNFLHLELLSTSVSSTVQHVLFYDVTGEQYDDAMNSRSAAASLKFIANADVVLFLVDGEKIVNKKTRQLEPFDCSRLLEMLIETNKLGSKSNVTILFSKSDLFENADLEFLESFERQISERYRASFKSLKFSKIAARPLQEGVGELCLGLDEPFRNWIAGEGSKCFKANQSSLLSSFEKHAEIDRFIT